MNAMQSSLNEIQNRIDSAMNEAAGKFTNVKNKSYMASNILILDFATKDYQNAIAESALLDSTICRAKAIGGPHNRIIIYF